MQLAKISETIGLIVLYPLTMISTVIQKHYVVCTLVHLHGLDLS